MKHLQLGHEHLCRRLDDRLDDRAIRGPIGVEVAFPDPLHLSRLSCLFSHKLRCERIRLRRRMPYLGKGLC
jgi:hypothetical protein